MTAKQADLHQLPPLGQHVDAGLHRLAGAHTVDDGPDGATGGLAHLGQIAVLPGVEHGQGAGLHGCGMLGLVGLDNDHTCAAHGLGKADGHQAQAASANEDELFIAQHLGRDFLQRAVGGQARARIGRGLHRRHVANVHQVARVRHQHMVGIAAGLEHAHGLAGQAQVFVATLAYAALAAAMPGEDHVALADGDPLHGVAHGDDLAGDLVAHGQRQLQATVGHGQLLAMAQVVGAMPDVQVGMAHTRGLDAHQHLVAHRPGRGTLALDQGLAALDHVIADHLVSFGCHKGLTAQFMAVKAGCTATSHVRDTGHSPMTSDARSFPYRPWNFGFSTRSQRVLT